MQPNFSVFGCAVVPWDTPCSQCGQIVGGSFAVDCRLELIYCSECVTQHRNCNHSMEEEEAQLTRTHGTFSAYRCSKCGVIGSALYWKAYVAHRTQLQAVLERIRDAAPRATITPSAAGTSVVVELESAIAAAPLY